MGIGDQQCIDSFTGEHRFLSNFYPAPVRFGGIQYPSVEHAYQAQKTLDMDERIKISKMVRAGDAKRAGRKIQLRKDWERIKVSTMRELLRIKFYANKELGGLLVATGSKILIEGNTWGDHVWGMCRGKGQNLLGVLLMEVRAELAAK